MRTQDQVSKHNTKCLPRRSSMCAFATDCVAHSFKRNHSLVHGQHQVSKHQHQMHTSQVTHVCMARSPTVWLTAPQRHKQPLTCSWSAPGQQALSRSAHPARHSHETSHLFMASTRSASIDIISYQQQMHAPQVTHLFMASTRSAKARLSSSPSCLL
jgi:hypothetical protein